MNDANLPASVWRNLALRRLIDRLPWRCQFYSDQWGRQCDKPRGHAGPHGAY